MVWSHLSLGRAAKRKRWRRMRGRSERKGSTVEAGGGRQREVDEGHDGGGKGKEKKEMRLEIKKDGERSNVRRGPRRRGLLKDHIRMRNRRRVRGSYTGSQCPAASSLLLLTNRSQNHRTF